MKTPRNPDTIHPPLAAYSHQIEITGPERLLVIAGQVGMAPDGDVPDDPIEQLGLAIDNVERNLEAAGMELGDLVRLTTYLVGEWDHDARRRLVASRLGAHRPCMTLLVVAALAGPSLRVEIDAWASRAS
jgi:2-iminobutanoate/2-iminopropanoate deaminase